VHIFVFALTLSSILSTLYSLYLCRSQMMVGMSNFDDMDDDFDAEEVED